MASHARVLPDYDGGSIVNLMASLVLARDGRDTGYPPLRGVDLARLTDCRNLILLVVDGLGYHYLRSRPAKWLNAHLLFSATSVFPTSTASAITSFFTGLAPQQHGIVGWHLHFEEFANLLAVLPFRPRHGFPPLAADDVNGARVFTHETVFDRMNVATHVVAPERIIHSTYNRAHSGRAHRTAYLARADLFAVLGRLARHDSQRQFIYAYYPELDRMAHEHGIASPEAEAEIMAIDHACAQLADDLRGTDTTLVVTADHGFIDIPPAHVIDLVDHPQFGAMLRLPLAGEQRVAYCYLREGRRAAFLDYANTHFADSIDVIEGSALIASGYFGPGTAHPALAARVGDYALIMKDGYAIKDWVPGERRFFHVGFHGGLSADEMHVPIVIASV